MTAVKGKWTRVLIGRRDASGAMASVEIRAAITTEDTTTFQATAREYTTTGIESTIDVDGYITGLTIADPERTIQARFGTTLMDHIGVLLQEDGITELGMPIYVLPMSEPDSYAISTPVAGIMAINASFSQRVTPMRRGLLLFRGAVTSTGVKGAIDFPAGGVAGGDVWLWVQDYDTKPTDAVITISSAPNEGGTFANEATLTFSDTGSYYAAMTGAIDKRLRVSVTNLGGATSLTFVIAVGINGVTQP